MLCWAGLGWLAGCCWLATHCVCGAASFNSVTSTCPPHNRLSRTQPPTAHRLPPPPPPSFVQDGELSDKNCSVAVVGAGMPFTLLEDEALAAYITGGCCALHAVPGPFIGLLSC